MSLEPIYIAKKNGNAYEPNCGESKEAKKTKPRKTNSKNRGYDAVKH